MNIDDGHGTTPVYVLLGGDVLLEAPLSDCWRHLLDYPSWQSYSMVRHVSGEPGQEGEVVMLRREEPGVTHAPYYARTIKLESQRRVLWKTYPEHRTADNDFFGIVDFRLSEQQQKVCLHYDVLFEFSLPHLGPAELCAFREARRADFEALFRIVLPRLCELVKTGSKDDVAKISS